MQFTFGTETLEETTTENSKPNNDPRPTIQQVLEWGRSYDAVVLEDWARNPTALAIGRMVFPERRGSSKSSDTSPLIKDAINQFYPNVNAGRLFKNACYVNVNSGSRVVQVMILESNLQAKQTWTEFLKGLPAGMLFPSYASAKRNAKLGTFLTVEGILIENTWGNT